MSIRSSSASSTRRASPSANRSLSNFTFDFAVPLNAAAAANAANYEVDTITTKKIKKKTQQLLHPITNFTVSYLAASNAVEIAFAANDTFPTGGQITVLNGLTTASGGMLSGTAVFTVSKGGKSIGPS